MNRSFFFIVLIAVFIFSFSVSSQNKIPQAAKFLAALDKAVPGDTIFLPAGTFKNWEVTIDANGTTDKPIVVSGSKEMLTIFSDTVLSKPFFRLRGKNLVLQNISFINTVFQKPIVVIDSAINARMNNCIFKDNQAIRQFNNMISVSGNGKDNKIINCRFENIANGQLLSVRINKAYPVNTLIVNNIFIDIPANKFGNGAESVQIGQDAVNYGQAEPKVIVENNQFIRCDGEGEIISNKCSGNVYRNNKFENCKGGLVLRGGHRCQIYGNVFNGGSMGVRISGTGHHVYNNRIENTNVGISLLYGTGVEDETAFYSAVSNCIIENNQIISPKECGIKIGDLKGKSMKVNNTGANARIAPVIVQNLAPSKNKIINNEIIAKKETQLVFDNAPDNVVEGNKIIDSPAK